MSPLVEAGRKLALAAIMALRANAEAPALKPALLHTQREGENLHVNPEPITHPPIVYPAFGVGSIWQMVYVFRKVSRANPTVTRRQVTLMPRRSPRCRRASGSIPVVC